MVIIKKQHAIGLILVLLLLFIVLSYYIAKHPINGFDTHVTLFLQSHSGDGFLRTTNAVLASSAFRIIYVLLIAAFIITRRYSLIIFVLAAAASEIISAILKDIFARPRPSAGTFAVYDPSTGFSFISGHTLEYTILFGFLGVLALQNARDYPRRYIWAAAAFLMPLVVGLGRVYSGAHWLTDVLGSYLLGTAILISMVCLLGKFFEPKRKFR